MITATKPAPEPEHICPRHTDTRLIYLLAGGSGYCVACRCYQQSVNHLMPELSPEIVAKRAAQSKPKRKSETKARRPARRSATKRSKRAALAA